MMYPLVSELAADGIPVTVTCRVLKLVRQDYYRWLADPVTKSERCEAYVADALFEAHRDDPEFGYRFLADEVRHGGGFKVCERTGWKICSQNGRWSSFGKKKVRNEEGQGADPRPMTIWSSATSMPMRPTTFGWATSPTPDDGGEALRLRRQGRLFESDRRLLDRRADEGPARRRRHQRRRCPSR
jgi:hypothetical protein